MVGVKISCMKLSITGNINLSAQRQLSLSVIRLSIAYESEV